MLDRTLQTRRVKKALVTLNKLILFQTYIVPVKAQNSVGGHLLNEPPGPHNVVAAHALGLNQVPELVRFDSLVRELNSNLKLQIFGYLINYEIVEIVE
jgi:hypothetical protein